MSMSKAFLFWLSCSMTMPAMAQVRAPRTSSASRPEVIYHVFERSFYDSNGDRIGDLNGLKEKLGYLQHLGVTSIQMVPIYQSDFYHNYFGKDFEKVDPAFGTMTDYIALVKAVHSRGMKIYMDMETQYITGDNPWYQKAISNPNSPYRDYILWADSTRNKPEGIIYNLTRIRSYDGSSQPVATVNLLNPKVLQFNINLFRFWEDPNHDGKFDDGVDGFRLDHMMDDLDNKGKLTGLFKRFWTPLILSVKKLNPKVIFIAEQANWGDFGQDYFQEGHVDRVFDFRLRFAIASFNKKQIGLMADSTLGMTPPGHQQIVFIENHDLPRFASVVGLSKPKEEIGGALGLLLGGVPSIYYGQELGMYGGFERYGNTDGNDIPKREAFEWYRSDTGRGMALWYKNTGPWWDSTHLVPNDGISLQEEEPDPSSLWNFYHTLIRIRWSQPALYKGRYFTLPNDQDSVFSFLRVTGDQEDIVMVNLSSSSRKVRADCSGLGVKPRSMHLLFGRQHPELQGAQFMVTLPAYAINLWKVN